MKRVPFFNKAWVSKELSERNKLLFDAWVEMGSLVKASKYLQKHYKSVTNTRGNPISSVNVWYGAWNWILENSDAAKPYFDTGYYDLFGEELPDERWHEELISKACTVYGQSERKFSVWAKKHNLLHYVDLYEFRFPNTAREYRESQGEVSE